MSIIVFVFMKINMNFLWNISTKPYHNRDVENKILTEIADANNWKYKFILFFSHKHYNSSKLFDLENGSFDGIKI